MNNMTTTPKTFPTLFDLFQHWCNAGYPDYVTGIWSTDGSSYNLTVGLVEGTAGEAGKQEILNLIENDASITFTTQTYSHNYLMQIQEELFSYFEQTELGMVGSGVYDMENCVHVEFLTEKENDEVSLNFIAELKEKYGNAVSISYTEGYVLRTEEISLTTPPAPSISGKSSFSPLLIAGMILIPLLVFGIYFALRKRFVPVLQTNAGGTFTQSSKISVKEVEEMVKDSSLTVSKEVDEKVMERIRG
ncbi:MAG: hypothetical protein IJW37_07285 [Lachnospiraceae bacterium]|nr:hypothetical protein [Lachnospiraceae bacterium]